MKTEYEAEEHFQELLADYGRVAFITSTIETRLVLAILAIEFVEKIVDQLKRTKGKGFDKSKYKREFNAFAKLQFDKTMGNLVKNIKHFTDFNEDLIKRIIAVKDQRNFIVHHYWRENTLTIASKQGRYKMSDELLTISETLEKLDDDIEAALKRTRRKIGVNDKEVDERVEKFLAENWDGMHLKK